MENNSLLVGIGVGTLFISLSTFGLYYYQKMGVCASTAVKNNKTIPEELITSSHKTDSAKVCGIKIYFY